MTRGFDVSVAIIAWLMCALAVAAMLAGNPTAVNGVIGAGIAGLIFTLLAIWNR